MLRAARPVQPRKGAVRQGARCPRWRATARNVRLGRRQATTDARAVSNRQTSLTGLAYPVARCGGPFTAARDAALDADPVAAPALVVPRSPTPLPRRAGWPRAALPWLTALVAGRLLSGGIGFGVRPQPRLADGADGATSPPRSGIRRCSAPPTDRQTPNSAADVVCGAPDRREVPPIALEIAGLDDDR